ncbi:MAG: hypothetical protein WDM92_14330 [Caulobacteraceae bacterium]
MDADAYTGDWLARLQSALAHPEAADWRGLFAEECYWRDLVAFTWNIVTLEGPDAIARMARRQAPAISPTAFRLDPDMPGGDGGWFDFETAAPAARAMWR